MSQNIEQLFIANPASSMISTDLFYLGRSPYGVTDDFAITWNNVELSISSLGTITTGVWNASLISPTYGGTGVNNGSSTFTIGGNASFIGEFTFAGTLTGNTAVTFPTSGTLATVGQVVTWSDVASSTQAMAVNKGYITDNGATLVTYTLPVTAAQGSVIEVSGKSSGLWTISQNAGQQIIFGDELTTLGAGGSIAATNLGDCVRLLCVTANSTFIVLSGVGNITVV